MSRSVTAAPRALDVSIADARGRTLVMSGLSRWLQRIAPAGARGRVSVALASDHQVRALNRRYRHVDRPTDVLSFPYGAGVAQPPATSHQPPFLGDIVIARSVARRQARERGHTELTELRVLALHGLLHLLGYDHEPDGGRMRRVEARLRRRGGLPEGLIERQRTRPPGHTGRRATQSE